MFKLETGEKRKDFECMLEMNATLVGPLKFFSPVGILFFFSFIKYKERILINDNKEMRQYNIF